MKFIVGIAWPPCYTLFLFCSCIFRCSFLQDSCHQWGLTLHQFIRDRHQCTQEGAVCLQKEDYSAVRKGVAELVRLILCLWRLPEPWNKGNFCTWMLFGNLKLYSSTRKHWLAFLVALFPCCTSGFLRHVIKLPNDH